MNSPHTGSADSLHDLTGFGLSNLRRDVTTPTSRLAWRRLLLSILFTVLAWLTHGLLGGSHVMAVWPVALLLGTGWFWAVQFILVDAAWRWIWRVWLTLALLPLILGCTGETCLAIAVVMTFTFLLFRRYRSYRILTSRQRARAFFAGLLILVALGMGWNLPPTEELSGTAAPGRQMGVYFLTSLRMFWIFSLFHLFFGMRLHFLRLKPKIFISWLFIAAVPMVLLLVFSVVTLYGSLGATRARSVRALLTAWTEYADEVPQPRNEFQTYFVYPPLDHESGELPGWWSQMQEILENPWPPDAATQPHDVEDGAAIALLDQQADQETGQDETDGFDISFGGSDEDDEPTVWAPTDTVAYFSIGPELWLMDLQGVGSDGLRVVGHLVDEKFLNRLSELTQVDVGLLINEDNLQGHYESSHAPPDSLANFWQRPLGFGGASFGTINLAPDQLVNESQMLHVQVRPVDLGQEFVVGQQTLNQVFLIVLSVIAVMFLLLEIGALFFGLRITGGITSAVGVLHQGTRSLARGDLDTRIQLPNEDEFGDLAASFNEMAVAVKRGQEEAVARKSLERELETAREIQERLLPHEQPLVSGFEITGISLPSRQVGGDYFDFLAQDRGRFGIAIGDVSGKGIPAALLMSNLQASLQGQVIHPSSVSEVVARVNDLLVRSTDPHMFATFFYGVLDSQEGTFTCTNAGHNPPLVLRASGELEKLEVGGIPLGWLPEQEYAQQTVALQPGDVIVMYTDGITEAAGPPPVEEGETGQEDTGMALAADPDVDADEEEDLEDMDEAMDNLFGDEALEQIVQASAHLSAIRIKDTILSAVTAHMADQPQSDDITLVVIARQRT